MSKKKLPPQKCTCQKALNERFDHRIGFIGAIGIEIFIDLYLIAMLIDYILTGSYLSDTLYLFIGWVTVRTIWFWTGYHEFASTGHSKACTKRYALLNLMYLRRIWG